MLMGMYQTIIGAIKQLDLVVFAVFTAGAGVGLLSFSYVLTWLLHRYHRSTFSVLVGFLVGSLYVIWPWKQVLSTMVSHSGKTIVLASKNLLPGLICKVPSA